MTAPPSSLRVGQVLNRVFALLSGDFVKFYVLAAIALSPYILLLLLSLAAGASAQRRAPARPSLRGLADSAVCSVFSG